MKKIRVAFVKYAGLSAGGTEKFLQIIAANLDRNVFEVDYFYCDAGPYRGSNYTHASTDPFRLRYMQERKVNLKKFTVEAKDIRTSNHVWVNTDFWKIFNEKNYDIVQTGRAGFPEYPFTEMHTTAIVDSLHLLAGVDNQYNISRVMHITDWSAAKWVGMGGDKDRVRIVSHPMEIPKKDFGDMREKYSLQDKCIFGFHQRNDDNIFSPIPLDAYKKIESDNTVFMMMGGGKKYRDQAKDLGIKNSVFVDHSADQDILYSFLNTLDVYAHGRKDGEVNSTAMAEAMYFGLPIVSHTSPVNSGHIECIAEAGRVLSTTEEYAAELAKLLSNKDYYNMRRENALKRFQEKYELKGQIENIEKIYKDVAENPFPNPLRRRIASFRLYYLIVYSWVRLYNKLKRKLP